MASINFDNLRNTRTNVQDYTYVDLWLDLTDEPVVISGGILENVRNNKDIRVAFDANAIKNSLVNLFNTAPGERFLLPDYGSDLRRYVFEPVSVSMAEQIGGQLYREIRRWEPRVRILNLDVTGSLSRQEYTITLELGIPFLTEPLNLTAILRREGFIFA